MRTKLFGGFGVVVLVMVVLVGAALVMQDQMASATGEITNVAAAKTQAGLEIKFAAADLVGWQEAYVLDSGKSRPAFLHSAATPRSR